MLYTSSVGTVKSHKASTWIVSVCIVYDYFGLVFATLQPSRVIFGDVFFINKTSSPDFSMSWI